jgi:aromatic-L-amino-acid decarboxylase
MKPSDPGIPDRSTASLGDMPAEDFRVTAHEAVDWIADYLDSVGDYPVLSPLQPGEIRASLPAEAPEAGESFDDILRDFREIVIPGVTHWNHPAFHAYFAVTGSGPGIIGEMFSAALNVNAMNWRSSPAGTELEELTTDWLRRLLNLSEQFDGHINDTASVSSLVALAAAREKYLPEARQDGLFGAPRARIYASEEAHSSIDKAVVTLGFGRSGILRIPTDDEFVLRVDLLREAIERDVAAGVRPVALVATLGTTSTTSVDPVNEMADLCEEFGMWLHVDSAYAGVTAMVPEFAHHFEGVNRADSFVVNPHKWLFTPVDCSVLFCRNPDMIRAAFSLTPEYLSTPEMDVGRNLMDYGVSLGRRFRALKLWFVLRYFGAEGVRERIREHCRMARTFAGRVDAAPTWERVAPVPFSTVVFRYAPEGLAGEEQDQLNMDLMDRVNSTGQAFLSHTRLQGRIALRLAVGNLRTRQEHLDRTWHLLQEAAREDGGAP